MAGACFETCCKGGGCQDIRTILQKEGFDIPEKGDFAAFFKKE